MCLVIEALLGFVRRLSCTPWRNFGTCTQKLTHMLYRLPCLGSPLHLQDKIQGTECVAF